jgi:ketosteroid isomerase-like protein
MHKVGKGLLPFGIMAIVLACASCTSPSVKTLRVMGQPVEIETPDAHALTSATLVVRFLEGFAMADSAALSAVVSNDFTWHLHTRQGDHRGRTVTGVGAMSDILKERRLKWRKVRYTDVRLIASGDRVFQTYRVTGTDLESGPFDSTGVDLYEIRNGKITLKDSYWKQ